MTVIPLHITNSEGIPFNATVTGQWPDVIITFYDARFTTVGFHPVLGQRLSSYYLSTLATNRSTLVSQGLDLQGGVDHWFLNASAMSDVFQWLDNTRVTNAMTRCGV